MSPSRLSLLIVCGGTLIFAQTKSTSQGRSNDTQEKFPSNQRDRTSPPKSDAQTSASTRSTGKGTLGNADRRFVMSAIRGGRMEVELGQIASERGSDPKVKSFGQMMVKDHTDGDNQLEALAMQKGLKVPADKNKERQLSNLSGEQFDRAYARRMVADHQKDVAEFQKAAQSANDSDVKALAQKLLPTLQMHLEQARMLQGADDNSRDRTRTSGTRSSRSKTQNSTNTTNTK